MEKQRGWAHKLGKAESLGISKAGQAVLTMLMESQKWHQLTSSVGGGFRKCAQMPDTSVSTCIPLVPFKLLLQCWSSEGESLSR